MLFNHSVPINSEILFTALEKIARGIYYYHANGEKKLLGRLLVFPLFLGIDSLASIEEREQILNCYSFTRQDMEEFEMLGVCPEIFSYQVIEDSEMIVINMQFYVDKVVSVMHSKT